MSTQRARRMALIDRVWLGEVSVLLATPLEVAPLPRIRSMLEQYLTVRPTAPLACRLDARGHTWIPVPDAERAAHLDRVLVPVADPEPGGFAAHIADRITSVPSELPFVAFVGRRSVLAVVSHALGDAASATRVMAALARADAGMLDSLVTTRITTTEPARALLGGVREHYREWIDYARHPTSPPATGAGPADGAGPRPAFAGAELDNAAVREITRWRNANAPGVALSSVLTTATYRALRREGVNVHGGGYYALIDMRSYLPDVGAMRFGNLAKALYLAADLGDPRSISAALGAAQKTRRALPATVIGSAACVRSRPVQDGGAHPADAPVMLTYNMVPTLPGLTDLPWAEERMRRFFGFGVSKGAGGVTAFALRMRDHLQLSASFDESTAPVAAVQRALESISGADALADLVNTPSERTADPA